MTVGAGLRVGKLVVGPLAAWVVATAGCSTPDPAPPPVSGPPATKASLGGDRVAVVDGVAITKGLAFEVSRGRKISPREAVDVLVEEALLAKLAVGKGALSDREVDRKLRAMLARHYVARMKSTALAEGPWTDAELDAAARNTGLWVELDRPETRTVAHALVRKTVPGNADLAKKLRELLLQVPSTGNADEQAKAFMAQAQTFTMPAGHALVVERLDDPFAPDGRMAVKGPPRGLEPSFAKGAFAVTAVGGTSEIVETSYGLHVIRVLSIQAGFVAPRPDRIRALEPELVGKRVGAIYQPKIAALFEAAKPTANDGDLLLPRVGEAPR